MSKFEAPSSIVGARVAVAPGLAGSEVQDRVRMEAHVDPKANGAPQAGTGAPADARAGNAQTRRTALLAVAAWLAIFVSYEGYLYLTVGRYMVSTDDSYIRADMTTLAAKVSGYVTSVGVKDNALVQAGDVLVSLDDGDYRLAVEAATTKLVTQQATIDRLSQQALAQQASVEQARAQISSAKAEVARTEAELARTASLAKSSYASVKSLDQAKADQLKAVAGAANAEAGLAAAQANLAVAGAQKVEAERTKAEFETSLAKANRDLSFATIKAPISGVIGNRAVQIGDYVQQGTRLLAVVPIASAYIEANVKETQLGRIKPGQPAAITVDALAGRQISGIVESVAPASGALFSLLPPENATGNFTKIVQRVPVRIAIVGGPDASGGGLRPGLSVTVEIDTRDRPATGGVGASVAGAGKP